MEIPNTFKLYLKRYTQNLKKTIDDYDLIPNDIEKVCIGMSGGKDAQIMSLLLLEYKKRERNDLELELLTVTTPSWKYQPDKYYKGDSSKMNM